MYPQNSQVKKRIFSFYVNNLESKSFLNGCTILFVGINANVFKIFNFNYIII